MTKILGLCGKKQSGKNSTFNFLLGISMLRLVIVRGGIEIKPDGRLWVSDLMGNEKLSGYFDIDRNKDSVRAFRRDYIYPFIRNYSFADLLKRSICMDLFGLTWEQCYGTDEQKNTPTELRWEDMPGVIAGIDDSSDWPVIWHEPGPMTAREVMQFTGTEIFRKMYKNVWAEGTIKQIINNGNDNQLAVITDCRFPNEVEAIQNAGGKVIRFTRSPFDDSHPSETALDEDIFDWNKFDTVIDNSEMELEKQNELVYKTLNDWGFFQGIEEVEETTILNG